MNPTPPLLRQSQVHLQLQASNDALEPLQVMLQVQARKLGFNEPNQQRMAAACEEALNILLPLCHDNGEDSVPTLNIDMGVENSALQVRISDSGLPYDLSLVSDYDPQAPELAEDDVSGLAAFLISRHCDQWQMQNLGKHGHFIELQWELPAEAHTLQTQASAPHTATADSAAPAAPVPTAPVQIAPLAPADAIHLARLMYRSYGYSYVNPDMYVSERIGSRITDGRLTSWLALQGQDQGLDMTPVGHIAFMKGHRDDDTLEVGSAVVAPSQRGSGLLGRLLDTATQALLTRPERAAFVHAVTAHPFTQKTFGRLGYLPTALLLAYTPVSLQFRSIGARAEGQRGSVYYACKLLKPVQPLPIYLLPSLHDLVLPRAQDIGLPLLLQAELQPEHAQALTTQPSKLDCQVEDALNAGFVTVQHIGQDFEHQLRKLLRQLCRQKVDVIYLSLNMSDAASTQACAQALQSGFIAAGLTPFMPWPATLCLQYLNNQWLEPEGICAVGPAAEDMRDRIFGQYRKVELLD